MVFRVAYDLNPATAGKHHVPLRHVIRGVVRALGVDVWTQNVDKFRDIRSVEYGHGVNVRQRCQQLRPLTLWNSRTVRALERARAGIRIHGDNELASKLLGRAQVANMANVQQVKTAVGQ